MSEEKIKTEENTSKKARDTIMAGVVMSVILLAIAYVLYVNIWAFFVVKIIVYILLILVFVFLMVVLDSFLDLKEEMKKEKVFEEVRKEELEFSEISIEKRALRAEKLFRMNQKALMRYYDLNMSQMSFLSKMGIVMIILGFLIVVGTLLLNVFIERDNMMLIIGSVSGIMVNFIGAVFIKMYTENIKAGIEFHTRFVKSNNLLLANSIVNKIENIDLREKTLAEISKSIITNNEE